MTKGVLPFLLLLILSVKLNGQSLLAHRYSMANGLPSNEVFSILKDKRGFMWIGTDRGLCKFDGETFQLFTTKDGLAENSTLEIKEDKFGRIWARSYSGLFSVLNKDSIWTLKINADITSLVIGNRLYQFELDDSMNLYLGERVYGNIYKSSFPYNSIQQIISPNTVIKYLQISDSKSLVSYTMNKVTSSGIRTVALILKNKTIQFPLQMKTAQLNFFLRYFTQSNEYVFSADNYLNTYNFLTNKINTKIFPFRISAMEVLSDSTYLVGGFKGELAIVNKKKDNFKLIDKFSSSISKILYHHNTCWITTLKNGIYYIPNIHYNIIHENTEPLISIMPIAKDSVLVLNANSEADIIGKNTKSRLPNSNNFKTLMYWQHFDQSQQEYIAPVGCFNYIINKKNKQKIYYNIDKKSNWKQTEFVVPMDGKIYVAYYGAVHVYMDGLSVAEYKLPFKDRATVMFGNKKTLFVGSLHGLLKIANQQIVPLDTHAFLQNKITAIDKIDENNLVIATPNNGIGIYNLQNKKLKIFYKSYGLDKLTIEHVFVDEEKKIWIATKTSIHVLKNVQGNAPILLDVTDLMLNDLSIKEIRCLNKVVYIIAGNKVITIQEPFIKFNMNVFSLVLNSVFINGKSYNLPSLDTIILKANQNNLLLKYQLGRVK